MTGSTSHHYLTMATRRSPLVANEIRARPPKNFLLPPPPSGNTICRDGGPCTVQWALPAETPPWPILSFSTGYCAFCGLFDCHRQAFFKAGTLFYKDPHSRNNHCMPKGAAVDLQRYEQQQKGSRFKNTCANTKAACGEGGDATQTKDTDVAQEEGNSTGHVKSVLNLALILNLCMQSMWWNVSTYIGNNPINSSSTFGSFFFWNLFSAAMKR